MNSHWISLRMLISIMFLLLLSYAGTAISQDDGFIDLIKKNKKSEYNKHGWNHYGPGYFTLDKQTGVLKTHGGMGLFWFSEKKFKNFILELDFKAELEKSNSGVFVRVPDLITSNEYIHKAFEIQIDDKNTGIHKTGSVYDAKAPDDSSASKGPGEWNHYKITCKENQIQVELNKKLINTWKITTPVGKIKEWHPEGYIGLQNHDQDNYTLFRKIRIKELD